MVGWGSDLFPTGYQAQAGTCKLSNVQAGLATAQAELAMAQAVT